MASAALKKAVKAILRGNPVLNYLAGVELCRRARGLDARGLVDLAFGFKVGFKALGMYIIRPWQVRSELLRLAELVAELRPAASSRSGRSTAEPCSSGAASPRPARP